MPFYNEPDSIVPDIVEAELAKGEITRVKCSGGGRVLIRSDWSPDSGKVAVLSGGGAGHEPAHAGFIGKGMLTGAIVGELFASPSVNAIDTAIEAVAGKAGCLLVVKNYTGDRLNFGLAAERARSRGHNVDVVLVKDDVSIENDPQPRGLSGTIVIHKVTGYLAEKGESLETISKVAHETVEKLTTIGLSLGAADVPGKETPPSEPALGLGIHNEPGAYKVDVNDAKGAVAAVLKALKPSPEVKSWVVLLNDLGGCSPQERGVLAYEVIKQFGIEKISHFIGPAVLLGSLDMRGFSVTLLPTEKKTLEALEAPVSISAWPGVTSVHSVREADTPKALQVKSDDNGPIKHDEAREKTIRKVGELLVGARDELDELDQFSGDGDAGSTFAAGGAAFLKALDEGVLPTGDDYALSHKVASLLENSMGGSSGILLSILFTSASTALKQGEGWPAALQRGIEHMQHYGGAHEGDRTMLDALIPAIRVLNEGGTMNDAAVAARKGANHTAELQAKAGRAAHVPLEKQKGHADPGAEAIARIFDVARN